MTDILRNDHAIQRALPNQYSELLQPACNGHALWAPRRTTEGGGALGDIGYIRDGSFWKEGNVYIDPPVSIQPLVVPTSGIYRGEHFHMPIMQSSSSSTVSFQVTGSATPATLPLTSVSVEPRFILKRKRLAFLAPPIPTVRDTVSVANETAFCDWLTDNRHRLDPSLVVLTHVVRSSGWIGGVVTGRNSNASVGVSGNVSALATVGMDASVEYEVARLALTQGPRPTEWSEYDAEYTLIVRFVRMRTRIQRHLHKIKLALSTGNTDQSSDSDMSDMQIAALAPRKFPIGNRGQGSAGSYSMSAAEDQAEQASEQDEDDVDSVDDASYDDEGDEGDRTCLDGILDMILDDNQDIDFVIADSRIVADFIEAYPHLSHSELAVFDQKPTRIRPDFTTRSIPSLDGNTTEIIAYVTRLSLIDNRLVLPSNVDSVRSMRMTCSGTKVATPDEAKLVVHGVICGYLPKIEWRLSAEERCDIRPGDVFVWEDLAVNADTGGTSLERWTDGRHWGPSRMRDEFLFYYERESDSDDLGYSRDPGTARMMSVDPTRYMRDQPEPTGPSALSLPLNANGALNPNRLIKQVYSVIVIRNGVPSKWHLTTYFTKASLPRLHSVRDIPALCNLRLPEANYIFFKAYKAQVAARAAQSSDSAAAAATFGSPSPPPPTSPYGRYATPGLPSPTELSSICYPHRNPEDQRAIQAFQRFSPSRFY